MSAFAALVHGSRRVRDNAMAYVAMQPNVDADVLHLAATWGNGWAKDLAIKHPNVCEGTLEAIAQGIGQAADNARRELARRRADASRELARRRGESAQLGALFGLFGVGSGSLPFDYGGRVWLRVARRFVFFLLLA